MTKRGGALAACLCIVLLAGNVARAQAGPDPIGAIKNGGTAELSLAAARAGVIAQGEAAVPRIVTELLTPAGSLLTARLNAAVCLAEIAKTGKSPQLKDALARCVQDESPGVKYWGVIGLGRDKGVTESDLGAALVPALDWNQPRLLRLAAVGVVGNRKVKAVLPYIMFMLEKLGADYIAARSQAFWPLRLFGGAAAATATPTMIPSEAIDSIVGSAPQKPLQDAAEALENSLTVSDIRTIGSAAEAIAGLTGDQVWEFTAVPPWQLQKPLVAALSWFKQNRKSYPGGPRLGIETEE